MATLSNKFIKKYKDNINQNGLLTVWKDLINNVELENIPLLYEIGLAEIDSNNKQQFGQYYTPHDVASLLSSYLFDIPGDNICDVCSGTGVLLLSYLELIGFDSAKQLLESGKIFIYNIDETALFICSNIIKRIYGEKAFKNLNIICCDFLDTNIILPNNCKVISNPPYAKIKSIKNTWNNTII